MPNPRNTSDRDREVGSSSDLAREHVRTLRARQEYVIGTAFSRRAQGLRADLEFREANALAFLLDIAEKFLDRAGNK